MEMNPVFVHKIFPQKQSHFEKEVCFSSLLLANTYVTVFSQRSHMKALT